MLGGTQLPGVGRETWARSLGSAQAHSGDMQAGDMQGPRTHVASTALPCGGWEVNLNSPPRVQSAGGGELGLGGAPRLNPGLPAASVSCALE